MSALTLAIRNTLAQDSGLTALLASSPTVGTWIFDTRPLGARFEQNSKCLIVISEEDEDWTSPNQHNTMTFPQVHVDIWADPDRNADKSIRKWNAQDKIKAIQPFIDRWLHLVDPGTSEGLPYVFGTATEMADKTGVVIVSSERRRGPVFSPISNAEGAFMGRISYGIMLP